MKGKKIWKIIRLVLVVYVLVGVLLYFVQDLIIFHPKTLPHDHVFRFDQPFKEININPDGSRNLSLIQFLTKEEPKNIVLYFHGNKTNIERYARFASYFTKNNCDVWMIDYPGYGKTTGKRTEQTMYSDALLLYQLAIKKTTPDNIIIYGKSLGTGPASYLAAQKPCKRLILETPYYSMRSMARSYVPLYPSSLIRYSFPVYQHLKQVNVPVTIFHGTADGIIPYKQSLKLKKDFPSIELITVPDGSHNNLYKFPAVTQKLDSLLAE